MKYEIIPNYSREVPVTIKNIQGFKHDEVTGKPIMRDGKVVGRIIGADNRYIYGMIDIDALPPNDTSFSIEVNERSEPHEDIGL